MGIAASAGVDGRRRWRPPCPACVRSRETHISSSGAGGAGRRFLRASFLGILRSRRIRMKRMSSGTGSFPWNRTLPETCQSGSTLRVHGVVASATDAERRPSPHGDIRHLSAPRLWKMLLEQERPRDVHGHKIRELLPDSRFLHVCRDGRAVALSAARKEAQKIEQFPQPYESRGIRWPIEALIDRFALYWQAHVLEIEALKRQRNARGRCRSARTDI